MRLTYSAPVPLRANCHVKYWFPTAYYDADDITKIRTGTLFAALAVSYYPAGSGEENEFTIAEEEGGYKSVYFNACENFRA